MNEMEKKFYVRSFGVWWELVAAEESGRVGGDVRKLRKSACGSGCGWERKDRKRENGMVIDWSLLDADFACARASREEWGHKHFFIFTSGCKWNKVKLGNIEFLQKI